jgi:hypothetical protein
LNINPFQGDVSFGVSELKQVEKIVAVDLKEHFVENKLYPTL